MLQNKKQIVMAVVLTLILSVAGIGAAFAQDSIDNIPGSGWWTGTQIQNVGTDTATLTISSYHKDDPSKDAVTGQIQINKDASKTFLPSDLNLGAGEFQGSATVASNQPLRAMVNTTNQNAAGYGVPGGRAVAQYRGVNNPATSLNFPLAKNGHYGKYTTFYIQNAGTAAANISATFKLGGGECTINKNNVGANRMVVISPQEPGSGCPSGNNTGLGAMSVTSSQALAGVVLEHGTENPAVGLQAVRGFAPADADATVYAPIIKSEWYGKFTGLQVSNAGGSAANVTVTYKGSDGACKGQQFQSQANIPAGQSATFVHLVSGGLPIANPLPAGCLASATVTGGDQLVAIVNEEWMSSYIAGGGNGGFPASTTYSGFAANSATDRISLPLYKEDHYGAGTGLQVQNVGNAQASNVVLTFIQSNAPGNSYKTKPQSIGAGASLTFLDVRKRADLWDGPAMPSNVKDATGVFAVVVTGDQNVVAVANETSYPFNLGLPGQPPMTLDSNNYEGFNLAPPAQ